MNRSLLLPLFALLLAGCGGAKDAPRNPAVVTGPGTTVVTTPPAPVADPHEMDPAKHVVPASPASGRLGGTPFTPDRVELQGDRLTFAQGKDFFPDLELAVTLPSEMGKPAGGRKIVVSPAQKWTDATLPMLVTSVRRGDSLPDSKFTNDGYALALELGKKANGKLPGKLYLCLSDAEKSHLAGTFEATVTRSIGAPPTADDAPFIQGAITHKGAKGQSLTVGYVGVGGEEPITDRVGSQLPDAKDGDSAAQSTTYKPRAATLRFEKGAPKYDFAKLPPGRYFLFARLRDGPVVWKWVEVRPDSQLTEDIALDGANAGTVEVKVPAGFDGDVRLVPADLGAPDPAHVVAGNIGFSLELQGKSKDGKATVVNVPAGKYSLFATPGKVEPRGTVEVVANTTATTELQPEKK